jgi:hypothetical protein
VKGEFFVKESTLDEHDPLTPCEWIIGSVGVLCTAHDYNDVLIFSKNLFDSMNVTFVYWLKTSDEQRLHCNQLFLVVCASNKGWESDTDSRDDQVLNKKHECDLGVV